MKKSAPYQPLEEPIKVPRFEEEAGFYTTPLRSQLMAGIRGKNTKPELLLRKALWGAGIRYLIHAKLPGKPDLVSHKYRFVVFVDGEFWHGQHWDAKKNAIKSNRAFWIPKIERNMQRDREVNRHLQQLGFKVFRFWAEQVQRELGSCVKQVLDYVEELEGKGVAM